MPPYKIEQVPTLVEPSSCIIEDLEVLAFENEEQMQFYTLWSELLYDRRRELQAKSDHERRVYQNEMSRKTKCFAFETTSQLHGVPIDDEPKPPSRKPLSTSQPVASTQSNSRPSTSSNNSSARIISKHSPAVSKPSNPNLSNGLTILNSSYYNTLPPMKHKLTKLYNKYRGRQMRRNLVNERRMNARIEEQLAKSHLNPWLSYTALQALRVPEMNSNQLSAVTGMGGAKFLAPVNRNHLTEAAKKTSKSSPKKQTQQQQQQVVQAPPMQLIYIDPGNLITYSNKINPRQVAEYKEKSHLLPSSATSKKSSAASYDVYEIMEVLANTNKTNVTITRQSNKNNSTTTYSHSVNANNPGIVSTQLHLQAKSYLDSMRKFYVEERQEVEREANRLKNCPSIEEIVSRYVKSDQPSGLPESGPDEQSSHLLELQGEEAATLGSSSEDSGVRMDCTVDALNESNEGDADQIDELEDDLLKALKEFRQRFYPQFTEAT